jgi:hypothetical protein
MKLNITEEEFKGLIAGKYYPQMIGDVVREAVKVLKQHGIEFKEEIDWGAESHDPSVIPDKWLVEAWDYDHTSKRETRFYDKTNSCVFTYRGRRDGAFFKKYRAIKKEDWPKWAIKAHKGLEY